MAHHTREHLQYSWLLLRASSAGGAAEVHGTALMAHAKLRLEMSVETSHVMSCYLSFTLSLGYIISNKNQIKSIGLTAA